MEKEQSRHRCASLVEHAILVRWVDSALVEVDEEDDIVAEAGHPVHGGHPHDEGEQVVDESVERPARGEKRHQR